MDSTSYLAQIYDLVASVPRNNLEGGPLLAVTEAVLQTLGTDDGETPFVLLPVWSCQAAGGVPQRAVVVAAAWCLLHTAALLLDDVQDFELALKPWPDLSAGQAINVATALISASQLALGHLDGLGMDADLTLAVWQAFSRAILNGCAGQHLDLCADTLSLDDYWQIAGSKSGAFFALACHAGAMLGTGDRRLIDRYAEFGYNLGILVQISDDFNGVWNSPGAGDLVVGTHTLPVVFALSVGSEKDKIHLFELLKRASSEDTALAEARQLIVDLGGLYYLSVQAEIYRRRARSALPPPKTACPAYDRLLDLLGKVMPVLNADA